MNEYEIKPPCLFFLSPGQAHKLELSKDINGYIFIFTNEFYLLDKSNKNKLLEFPFFFTVDQQNSPLFIESEKDKEFLISLFKRGTRIMKSGEHDDDTIHAILDLILCTCAELYPEEIKVGEKQKSHVLVKRFREVLEENYHNNPSIKELAETI